jgi:hypothetical protein
MGARAAGARRIGSRSWKPAGGGIREVAEWETAPSPRQCLRSWGGKAGMAGLEMDEGLKSQVLAELEAWALERFGDLDRGRPERDVVILEALTREH